MIWLGSLVLVTVVERSLGVTLALKFAPKAARLYEIMLIAIPGDETGVTGKLRLAGEAGEAGRLPNPGVRDRRGWKLASVEDDDGGVGNND